MVHVCKRKQPQHPRPLRGLENNYLTLDVGPEVVERRCTDKDRCAEALQFGVRTMPSVMVDCVRGTHQPRPGRASHLHPAVSETLLIGELARLAGVKRDAVRFYERSGLLARPVRSANGYRAYDETALARLRFIKKAQSLGFSLDEVKRILSLRGNGKATCRCVVAMAEATLEETERKLRETRRFATSLRKHLTQWKRDAKKRGGHAADFCKLIETS